MEQLDEAIYYTVHEYRNGKGRGAIALAPKLNMRPGTLSNKANPDQEHQLSLQESIPLQLVTNDFRILYAYASVLNHIPPLPFVDLSSTSDVDLLNAYAAYHTDIGETARAISQALSAKRMTRAMFKEIKREMMEDQRCQHELLRRLEVLIDE